jgi:hypothetical protein
VHTVAAGRLGISLKADEAQLVMNETRSLNDAVITAVVGIEIDEDEVRVLKLTEAAHVRVLINAAEVGEKEQ